MARPRVAAGALFFDAGGRILLVKPTYKDGWEIPGGYVEPGETPVEACRREVQEELGLERSVGRALAIDWAPSEKEGDKVLFVFDGGRLADDDLQKVVLPEDELERFDFFEVDQIDALLIERLARRVRAAAVARGQGDVAYLEHGAPVSTGVSDWWTTEDAADFMNVSTSTVRSYLARGQMPAPDRRFGRLPVWQPETIQVWHAARRASGRRSRTE